MFRWRADGWEPGRAQQYCDATGRHSVAKGGTAIRFGFKGFKINLKTGRDFFGGNQRNRCVDLVYKIISLFYVDDENLALGS